MKKVKVNEEACIGCGACVAIDPEHFAFNDNGLSEAISQGNLESAEVINAIESCPTTAIVMVEATEECECENCDCKVCDCGEECSCDEDNNCEEICDCKTCECACEHTKENEEN